MARCNCEEAKAAAYLALSMITAIVVVPVLGREPGVRWLCAIPIAVVGIKILMLLAVALPPRMDGKRDRNNAPSRDSEGLG